MESVKCVEQEMSNLDKEERMDRPPKKVKKPAGQGDACLTGHANATDKNADAEVLGDP